MKQIIFIIILSFLSTQIVIAQQRTCGKDLYMQKMLSNPAAKQRHDELQRKFQIALESINNSNGKTAAAPTATIFIPVAIHFPAESSTSNQKACLQTLAQRQIDVLNADYNAINADISKWSPSVSAFYPGTDIGKLNVQFVIATQNHPAGSGLVNGDKAITFGTSFLTTDDEDLMWKGYMNIVCKSANGNLGYSPLGGFPINGEAVVINFDAFGTGGGCTGFAPSNPYNLGRTLTHEIGHFFNLEHTFDGCTTDSNCATQGDFVCDTPASDVAVGGCPTAGQVVKCNVTTLTMNYMDYTNDACMYMFTAGQANRMQAYYNSIAAQFSNNVLANNSFTANAFSVFPNPNNGSFAIQMKENIENFEVNIYDILGRNIYTKTFNTNQNLQTPINLNGQSAGVYLVSIKNDHSIFTKKIVIQ